MGDPRKKKIIIREKKTNTTKRKREINMKIVCVVRRFGELRERTRDLIPIFG